MDINIDYLRKWIGKKQTASELVTSELVRRFNATFDRSEPVEASNSAPPLLHFCLAQPAAPTTQLGSDGHPALGSFLPPVPLPKRMWAGGRITFQGEIKVGETVGRTSTIRDVQVKQGRTGALCFVTVDHDLTSNGLRVLSERQDIVYRGGQAASASGEPRTREPEAKCNRRIRPGPQLLFRYSSLTFNAHRIHYDLPFATTVEGYPGLVVQGPLQATMLALLATELWGTRPEVFSFRSKSPIFDTTDFTLNAVESATGLHLWTAPIGGPVAMEAQASW